MGEIGIVGDIDDIDDRTVWRRIAARRAKMLNGILTTGIDCF